MVSRYPIVTLVVGGLPSQGRALGPLEALFYEHWIPMKFRHQGKPYLQMMIVSLIG